MSEKQNNADTRPVTPDARGPWVIDTRDLARRAGASRDVHRWVPVDVTLGVPDVIEVSQGAEFELDVLLESVVEGVLVTGTATAPTTGQCSRCLEEISDEIQVEITELFAYPHSATEATTEEGEASRIVDGLIDLEPVVRDAVVLALPQVPLCTPECPGLCPDCGLKWADLEPGHAHEKIDPRWAALVEQFGESSPDETRPEGGSQG